MKYKSVLILLFLLVSKVQLSASLGNKIYSEDEINIQEVIYNEVDYTKVLEIWQIELEINPLIVKAAKSTLKKKLRADVYMPPKAEKPRGFIMFMFGSAFLASQKGKKKKSVKVLCMEFAQRGYVTASIDYRLMNILTPSFAKAGYVATQDAKSALQYFANNHSEFNIDPNNFFVGGISAGAFTAINAAFLDNGESLMNREKKYSKMYGNLYATCPKVQKRYTLRGVINISGAVYDLSILNNNVPIINFHGNSDLIVPHEKALPFTPIMDSYNDLLGKMSAKLAEGSLARKKFYEAEMFPVYGSKCIKSKMRDKNCYYVEFDDCGHKLLLEGLPKRLSTNGNTIIEEIDAFISKHSDKNENRSFITKLFEGWK